MNYLGNCAGKISHVARRISAQSEMELRNRNVFEQSYVIRP
jgi:hypothetical protein